MKSKKQWRYSDGNTYTDCTRKQAEEFKRLQNGGTITRVPKTNKAGNQPATTRQVKTAGRPELTPSDWTVIVAALKAKMKSPTCAGRDRESTAWRAHLREIIEAIKDGEQASLNAQDWAEVYYSLDRPEAEPLIDKIGPDGKAMTG